MHPGVAPHLQQLQAHLLRSGGLLPPLTPHPPGAYQPPLQDPKTEVSSASLYYKLPKMKKKYS
jgi:hypothetical protein